MHEEIEALRSRIEAIQPGPGGRRSFTAAVRKDVRELAARWGRKGRTLQSLADVLGLHQGTLSYWCGQAKTKTRALRRVEVRAERKEAPTRITSTQRGLVAVLPTGLRIEGLSLADVIELVSALR